MYNHQEWIMPRKYEQLLVRRLIKKPPNKRQGPDHFPGKMYKTFKELLIPILLKYSPPKKEEGHCLLTWGLLSCCMLSHTASVIYYVQDLIPKFHGYYNNSCLLVTVTLVGHAWTERLNPEQRASLVTGNWWLQWKGKYNKRPTVSMSLPHNCCILCPLTWWDPMGAVLAMILLHDGQI